ncbi:helix-turn-helix domain-containing protein [Cohnella sp. F6_2S_P_1]|uniref:Helix-turn-helix domain-containing protein n=1 Tax=Cohnella hashimotonis TaxID=2826895 RepID=A0ABT6TJU8_9BACL|nr:helix-turn-helix domain-containing protein [Cohnella hashimotonis]MDI4647119.1 helix-turn-helix domain-containing protein [Cohnella hashimotonis]
MKKIVVVEKIISGHMANAEGAAALGLTSRQVMRLKKRYVTEGGAAALAHRYRGRKPAHALADDTKERVAALYNQQYVGSNNCHLAELLTERDALELSPSSVRRILLSKGLKQAKQRRRKKAHQPRERRSKPVHSGKSMRYWVTPVTHFDSVHMLQIGELGRFSRRTEWSCQKKCSLKTPSFRIPLLSCL